MHAHPTNKPTRSGFDIDSESRLIVINGQPGQVFAAFEVVIDILFNSHQHSPHSSEFQAQLLIENSKAGKVVGQKGATIQVNSYLHISHNLIHMRRVTNSVHHFRSITGDQDKEWSFTR